MLLPKNERGFSFPVIRTDHAFITAFWWAVYNFFYRAELDGSGGLAESPASHERSISNGEAAAGDETGWPKPRQMEEAASCHVVADPYLLSRCLTRAFHYFCAVGQYYFVCLWFRKHIPVSFGHYYGHRVTRMNTVPDFLWLVTATKLILVSVLKICPEYPECIESDSRCDKGHVMDLLSGPAAGCLAMQPEVVPGIFRQLDRILH